MKRLKHLKFLVVSNVSCCLDCSTFCGVEHKLRVASFGSGGGGNGPCSPEKGTVCSP